jgi:hypothetical protein
VSGSLEFLPQSKGRHRVPKRGRRTGALLSFRTLTAAVSVAALAAAAVFAVGSLHESGTPHASAQIVPSLPRPTKAEVRDLEHMTPAEASRLTNVLDLAYRQLGVRVGVAAPGSATLPSRASLSPQASSANASLTSYQWSGGVQWDHMWVTASYANLQPYANNLGAVSVAATAFCTRVPGWWGVACAAIGGLISYFLGKVHVTNWSGNHGVWAAYYWFPRIYETGGTW